jgi:hypothetical protein
MGLNLKKSTLVCRNLNSFSRQGSIRSWARKRSVREASGVIEGIGGRAASRFRWLDSWMIRFYRSFSLEVPSMLDLCLIVRKF